MSTPTPERWGGQELPGAYVDEAAQLPPTHVFVCTCAWHAQDAGGGYTEYLMEPEPSCPEHGSLVAYVEDDGPPCCTGGACCGPGSYCCARTGPHDHPELEEDR